MKIISSFVHPVIQEDRASITDETALLKILYSCANIYTNMMCNDVQNRMQSSVDKMRNERKKCVR